MKSAGSGHRRAKPNQLSNDADVTQINGVNTRTSHLQWSPSR